MKILKFYTNTCPPCKMMSPILQAVSTELGLPVEAINAAEQPELARKFNIISVPALVILKDDQEIGRRTGLQSRPLLKSWLKGFLNATDSSRNV